MRTNSTLSLLVVPIFVILLLPSFISSSNGTYASSTPSSTLVNLSNDSNNAHYPFVASVGNYVYVAWTEQSYGIRFRASSDNGAAWTPATSLPALQLSGKGGTSSYPVISANESNVYVTWSQVKSGLGQIFIATSIDNGLNFGSARSLSTLGYNSVTPVVASAGSNVYVAWRQTTVSTAAAFVEVAISHDKGVTWSLQNMSASLNLKQDEPQLAAWNKNVYLVWDVGGAWVANSTTAGASWTIVNLNPEVSPTKVREPWVATSGSNVYVTWNDNSGYGATNGQFYHPYIDVSNNNGATWGGIVNLFPKATSDWEVEVAASGNSAFVTFRDHTAKYSTNGDVLFEATYDAGSTWVPALGSSPLNLSNDPGITGWATGIAVSGNTVALVYPSNCVTGQTAPFPNSGSGDCTMEVSYSNSNAQTFFAPLNASLDRTAGPTTDIASSCISASGSYAYAVWQDEPQTTFQVYFSAVSG